MKTAQKQPGIRAETQYAEALLATFNNVFMAGHHDAAVFALGTKCFLDCLQPHRDSRPFPLSSIARSRGIVSRSEEKQVDPLHLRNLFDISASSHGLDDGH